MKKHIQSKQHATHARPMAVLSSSQLAGAGGGGIILHDATGVIVNDATGVILHDATGIIVPQ